MCIYIHAFIYLCPRTGILLGGLKRMMIMLLWNPKIPKLMTSTLCMMWISSVTAFVQRFMVRTNCQKWICHSTREVRWSCQNIFTLHMASVCSSRTGCCGHFVDGNFNWLLPLMIIWQIIEGTSWPTIFVYICRSPFTWMFVSVCIRLCKYKVRYTCNYLCMCTGTDIVIVLCLAFLFSNSISACRYVIVCYA